MTFDVRPEILQWVSPTRSLASLGAGEMLSSSLNSCNALYTILIGYSFLNWIEFPLVLNTWNLIFALLIFIWPFLSFSHFLNGELNFLLWKYIDLLWQNIGNKIKLEPNFVQSIVKKRSHKKDLLLWDMWFLVLTGFGFRQTRLGIQTLIR